MAEWGVEALNRFNGMFALALWDRKERTIIIARDRYGIKPLYISQQGNTLAFGSEQKQYLQCPILNERSINLPYLNTLLFRIFLPTKLYWKIYNFSRQAITLRLISKILNLTYRRIPILGL